MSTRPYNRKGRLARADELTADILDSVLELVEEMDVADVNLELAAKTAGVSVPTIVRKFESKDGLYAAAFARARLLYKPERERSPADTDVAAFLVRAQLSIYERWGHALIYLRTRERQWPTVHEELEKGRIERRRWLKVILAEILDTKMLSNDLVDQVFALTDVHFWAVFRLDMGSGKKRTQAAMEHALRTFLSRQKNPGDPT